MKRIVTFIKRVMVLCLLTIVGLAAWYFLEPLLHSHAHRTDWTYQPRSSIDPSGFQYIVQTVTRWDDNASLEDIAKCWWKAGERQIAQIDEFLKSPNVPPEIRASTLELKSVLYIYESDPERAYKTLLEAREFVRDNRELAEKHLCTIFYLQGLSSLRQGENDNCIMCRGECSCILPIHPSAFHTNRTGSERAIRHFHEYLDVFPEDVTVRWLLNLAHMTLGEYPNKVDSRFLVPMDTFFQSEMSIGRFRDIGIAAQVNRFNQAGGAIMEDFNNDGLLDIATTSFDPCAPMELRLNKGDGTFQDVTKSAGLEKQLGGLFCVQTDFDNDGNMDIFIPRGAWMQYPMRPSLLRNDGKGHFEDVTKQAGLLEPVNSNSACWADYDNDGDLDLFVCCEQQLCRFYRNEGNGKFVEMSQAAGLNVYGKVFCKGATWIDYDKDNYPDLFLNCLDGNVLLFRNTRDGKFREVSHAMGIDGPIAGFSCWAWDYDNDGWMDIFATCYIRELKHVIEGMQGKQLGLRSNRLYRNENGKRFVDVTAEAGLDKLFETMGSNFADLDNDGYLDMYLATGEPNIATLIPNRMFKNVQGKRFVDITASSGTGSLQKGHAVACGDWDRDGNTDIFVEMGGAIHGDQYHNMLFQNPGSTNAWLTVKLVGKKSNRAAIGARIKVVTDATDPKEVCRTVSSGSSFGANPLQQTIGLGKATRIVALEVYWPTTQTTQVIKHIDINQAIEIHEFEDGFRKLDWRVIPQPK